jgi:hypothetical protein
VASKAVAGLGIVGSVADLAGTGVNTYNDIQDIRSGAKKQRYTEETIDALGKGATPWQAAKYYQLAKNRDALVDHAKVAYIALHDAAAITAAAATGGASLKLPGGQGSSGMVTAFGGARVHTDNILPFQDVFVEGGKELRAILGKQNPVEKRLRAYRNRDGYWNGFAKTLAGNYFAHEKDHVMNQIKRERRAFDQRAGEYISQLNPRLSGRLANAANGVHKAYLLSERNKWLKNKKGADKVSYYDRAAKEVGADTSTL